MNCSSRLFLHLTKGPTEGRRVFTEKLTVAQLVKFPVTLTDLLTRVRSTNPLIHTMERNVCNFSHLIDLEVQLFPPPHSSQMDTGK